MSGVLIRSAAMSILVVATILAMWLPLVVQAADPCPFGKLEVPIPGTDFDERTICEIVDSFKRGDVVSPVRAYAAVIANIIIAIIVALGLIMITVAGYIYMTSGGDASKVGLAKTIIGSAILGMVLALAAFVILNTINPELVGGS